MENNNAIPKDNDMSGEETFEDYMRNARNEFVEEINKQDWNTELRVAAENILIAYDQMRDKILNPKN